MKRLLTICALAAFVLAVSGMTQAGVIAVTTTDETPTAPLSNPVPSSYQPRYISGFGSGDSFTVFFEDRDAGGRISYVSTTSGPTGFPASATATDILSDTHFCVKDWPISIGGIDYDYRAWASVGNNLDHHFYVSNNLTNWTLVSTFTIPNAAGFTGASGFVYYGFHDVILINGTYYAWGESNTGQTMMCRSVNGDDVWKAFEAVGGTAWGPLQLPGPWGGTPTGAFFDLGLDRGYGKIMVPGDDSAFYLAINTAAKASLSPADLETAFINPNNWTWHDGTTGLPTTPILEGLSEHDWRECWLVPNGTDWIIVYDADFGSADGGKALGYAILSVLPPPSEVWVDDDYTAIGGNDGHIWGYDAFDNIQDGINAVANSTVHVAAGIYNERLSISKSVTLLGAQAGIDPTAAGARTNPLVESTITEAGLSTPNPDVLIEIPSGVTDVTIDGFTLVGDPTNPIADTSVIRCWDDNILTVDQNRMVVNKLGVTVQPNPATNVEISGNVFTLGSSPAGDESAIYMTSTTNASITGNTATGFINAKGAAGSNNTNLLISENTFTGNKDAVSFWGTLTFVTIRDNVLSDSLRYGISIKGQDISILGNDITGNGDTGVNIDRHVIDTERVNLQCNNISGNINYGVQVNTDNVIEIINAEYNYWGDASGPSHSTNPGGLGDAVTDKVDFDPWYSGLMVADITPSITPVDTSFTLTAEIAGCCDPVAVQYDIGGIANGYMTDPDDDGIYSAENIVVSVPGVHDVYINVEDCYGIETQANAMLAVYDPDGGFVTGGGWIDSPQGAYTPDPSLTGKANFGFVAKYDKKTKLPVGNTEFVFKAGNINFHSSSYQWLVVNKNESRAQFKGSGTINGEGDYKFMLRAGDGEPDTFWIQIWEEDEFNDDELVIYDNGEDQMIGGGSIVVHAK
ncbi:MAG: right-handed parallel beta-helix repeat-containing protein [Planctomycetota bacterium]|jgi:hypothetical protein